jgi:type IV pilus assembly protein PilE
MSHPVSAKSTAQRRTRGFTLIEVMITVAIIAILSAVAVPAYTDYIRRGQLPDAFNTLSDYRIKMEQYYQDNRHYGVDGCGDVGGVGPSWNTFSATKYFTYACRTGGQTYDITAVGSAGRAIGYDYSINQAGTKGTTKYAGALVTASCWMSKSSTSCD